MGCVGLTCARSWVWPSAWHSLAKQTHKTKRTKAYFRGNTQKNKPRQVSESTSTWDGKCQRRLLCASPQNEPQNRFWLSEIPALRVDKETETHCVAAPTGTGRNCAEKEGEGGGLHPGDAPFRGDTDKSELQEQNRDPGRCETPCPRPEAVPLCLVPNHFRIHPFCGTRDWAQGFVHARHVPYPWVPTPRTHFLRLPRRQVSPELEMSLFLSPFYSKTLGIKHRKDGPFFSCLHNFVLAFSLLRTFIIMRCIQSLLSAVKKTLDSEATSKLCIRIPSSYVSNCVSRNTY